MKTQKKSHQGLYLKSNNRWKWMAAGTVATAAGVTASQASTITVNLVNNYIDGFSGNHLNADLTGDGRQDLTIANAQHGYVNSTRSFASVILDGVQAHGSHHNSFFYFSNTMTLGSRHARYRGHNEGTVPGSGTPYLTGSIPIFFKDLHINGGARTRGSLEVTVSGANISLDSLTYTSTTPDQGSSLALLAMGAGGILALRRWRAARGRC
jgi:hypothetical protein